MTDTRTVFWFWTLRKDDNQLGCSVERLRDGLQVHMAVNGDTPYHSRTCKTSDELLSWTADEHEQRLTDTRGVIEAHRRQGPAEIPERRDRDEERG